MISSIVGHLWVTFFFSSKYLFAVFNVIHKVAGTKWCENREVSPTYLQ